MKPSFNEGDVFAVTLGDGSYALGVLARVSPAREILLGYFFGPRLPALPAVVPALRAGDAAMVLRFGYLHLKAGKWPVLSRIEPWRREEWPIPRFIREEPIHGKTWLVTYSDSNPAIEIAEERCERELMRTHERAVLSGAVAVELKVAKRLP